MARRQPAGGRRYMARIRIVVPVTTGSFAQNSWQQYSASARRDTELSIVRLDKGPASIESAYEGALAVPDTVAKIVEAENGGIAAVVCDCMGDFGLHEARELVSIPVIGPGETSMHIAAMLGHRFSVVHPLERMNFLFDHHAAKTGVTGKLASIRTVDIPVLELNDRPRLLKALADQSATAVREDGAHLIIFGCTGMVGLAHEVEVGLRKNGIGDVPVLDPAILALKIAEAMADMGLSHSKRTYPAPPEKEIVGYELLRRRA
jgi:allantoin racemase